MTGIDPIVQLSVAMATSPGSYAVLVGSGVSLEAQIPTGEQVLRVTLEKLYAATNPDTPTPSPDVLNEWAKREGLDKLGYSEMLARVFPAENSRRDFLAGLFRGTTPGPSHHALAQLAKRGLVRVFITTNLDPHLEDALKAAGLEPIVVSDGPTLLRAPARENSPVFVVKPHGDVGQVNIRNTLAELDKLDDRMEEELQEICSRYGVIAIGYAGRDAAITRALRKTTQRFGLYWMARRSPTNPEAEATLAAVGGHLIVRDGAGAFLADLTRRIDAVETHPTGVTPTSVRADMVERLRASDTVGIRELLRSEQRELERAWADALQTAFDATPGADLDPAVMKPLELALKAAIGRHLGSVLPLIEYKPEFLAEECAWLAEFAERESGIPSPYGGWTMANRVPAWHLVWAIGAAASAMGRYEVLGMLWKTSLPYRRKPLASLTMLGAHDLERALFLTVTGHHVVLDGLTHTARIIRDADVVADHYPELTRGSGDPLSSIIGHLQDAAYVFLAFGNRDGVRMPRYAYEEPNHLRLPNVIQGDRTMRQGLSALFDTSEEEVVGVVVGLASGKPAV